MPRRLCLLILLLASALAAQAQGKFMTRYGLVTFFSATPIADIEARNANALSVIDLNTGQLAVSVLMKEFVFERALMQQHFNESYVESEKFPKATFTGKLIGYQPGDVKPGEKLSTDVEGELTLHGVKRPVKAPVILEFKDGKMVGTTKFTVAPADYNIEIPLIVRDHIAKSVDVFVTLLCEPTTPQSTADKK